MSRENEDVRQLMGIIVREHVCVFFLSISLGRAK